MADFSLSILGKKLEDLAYQDIVDFFADEKIENNKIEFKSFPTTGITFSQGIKGVIRTICGLLNSEGGLVVWGAPIGIADPITNEKRFSGGLSPVTVYEEKDKIINKISDTITPLPSGINITILQRTATENLYIFEVQKSPYSPHQYDNTYFVRLDGQTRPAPHYFIEALFKKITYPNIEGFLKFDSAGLIRQTNSLYYLNYTVFIYNFSPLQNEENVIYRVLTTRGGIQLANNSIQSSYNNTEPLLHFGTPMMNSKRIVMTPYELSNNNFIVEIALTVAGKKSPVKASTYKLNLKNIDLSNEANTSKLIEESEENILLFDKQQKLGTTRESTLLSTLGRIPQ